MTALAQHRHLGPPPQQVARHARHASLAPGVGIPFFSLASPLPPLSLVVALLSLIGPLPWLSLTACHGPRASTHPLAVLLRSILHYRRLCAHALAPTEELRWGGLLLSTLLCAPVRLDAAACAYMGFTDSWLGGEGKKQCLTP